MPSCELHQHISVLSEQLAGKELNHELQDWLNQEHGVGTSTYREIEQSCRNGVTEGWLCQYEAGGVHYGRVFKPDAELHGFSVDVVDVNDLSGPHHCHPAGEINLVMPVDAEARFDGHAAGWVVYEAGSAHRPTVCSGRALILYLLPDGSIEFTR